MNSPMFRKIKAVCFLTLFAFVSAKAQEVQHQKIENINSAYNEFNPVLSPDGNRLYFTRAGHAANIGGVIDRGDIWYSNVTDSGYTKPVHAGKVINHQGLNGVVGFSADGTRMYLLNYLDDSGNGVGTLRNGVAMSTLVNGEWSEPERLRIRYFQNDSPHMSATISRDEKVLIMAIKSYLTEGNEDLYVSFAQADGEWSQPQNLGNVINTYAEEWTPFLDHNNKKLYFASNGHGGKGSRDIFVAERMDGSWTNWSEPQNLGDAINTAGVELGFSIPFEGNTAYLSSTQDSEGLGDIVSYEMDSPIEPVVEQPTAIEVADEPEVEATQETMVVMTFQVLDKRTEKPVSADVLFEYNGQELRVNTGQLEQNGGKFMKAFEEQTKVDVTIEAGGYLKYTEQFEAFATTQAMSNEFESGVETFFLTPEDVGTKMTIENVLFNRGSDIFSDLEVAHSQIDVVVKMMKDNPGMAIRLEGHTDNRGDARLLKKLSEDRVKAVRHYMIAEGIDGERIEFVGYGGEQPVSDNDNPTSREMNRRVEFVIIK